MNGPANPRYYSCPLDAEHGWHALAYVERNPVRAGLTSLAEEYRWSSVQARLGLIATPEWLIVAEWQRHYDAERWRHVLAAGAADQAWRQRIQEATLAGKPVGSQEFVRRLADDFDRNMEIRPPGRPSASRLSVA